MYRRICKYCGKEFDSKTPSRQICDGPHYRKCDICGKLAVVPNNIIYEKSFTCNIKTALSNEPKGYNDHKTSYVKQCVLSQTETQIMESHGFLKVYDSGTITWKWGRY